jgi:hypothetical protein
VAFASAHTQQHSSIANTTHTSICMLIHTKKSMQQPSHTHSTFINSTRARTAAACLICSLCHCRRTRHVHNNKLASSHCEQCRTYKHKKTTEQKVVRYVDTVMICESVYVISCPQCDFYAYVSSFTDQSQLLLQSQSTQHDHCSLS